jgi:hypothetical protein
MGQITMEIECRANSAPKKERQHDGQIEEVKARQESDRSEHLERDEDDENEKIELFVFKHAAKWTRMEQPTGPQLNPEVAVSHGRETISNRYSRRRSASRQESASARHRNVHARRVRFPVHVGARGFEPPTSWSQTTRSTKLSYAPDSA